MPTSPKKSRLTGDPPKRRENRRPKGLFREIFVSANREIAPFGMVFAHPPENFEQKRLGTVFGLIKISDTSPESSFVANLLASVIKKEYFSRPERPAYDSFEASLKKANLALAELARQGSVKWIGHISFAGGALEKNNLYFSKLGNTSILLLRGGMLADIGAGLDEDASEVDSHPIKTFSDISSGKVELGDRLVFTTSDLLEIFSFEEIRQNAARFSQEEFPEIISASLTANSELSGAIVVSMVSAENIPEMKPTEDKQSHIFTPRSSVPSVAMPPKNIPQKIFTKKIFSAAKNTFSGAKNGAIFVWKKAYRFLGRIDWRKIFSTIKEVQPPQWGSNLHDWSKTNKRNMKIAGVIVVLLAVSFSIFKIVGKKDTPAPQPVAPSEQNTAPAASSDINAKNVENISDVAALPAGSSQLIFMNNMLFSLTGEKSILKIDPASGATEKSDSTVESGKFTLAAAMPDLNTIFILTSDKKVVSFTPSNKRFQENAISFPDNLDASDMKAYLTYLYILDPKANRIYRYPRAEGGFGDRQDWLRSGQDLKDADRFAINNDIFAADSSNIVPFLQGKIDGAIEFEKPQTALRVDAIYTDRDFANIYVLDNANHRIMVYSVDGKIATQYFSSQISGIKDIVADEKNKLLYLENSTSVSRFSME